MGLGWLADTLQIAGMQQLIFKKPSACVAPRPAGSGQEPALLGTVSGRLCGGRQKSQKRIINDHLMLVSSSALHNFDGLAFVSLPLVSLLSMGKVLPCMTWVLQK